MDDLEKAAAELCDELVSWCAIFEPGPGMARCHECGQVPYNREMGEKLMALNWKLWEALENYRKAKD